MIGHLICNAVPGDKLSVDRQLLAVYNVTTAQLAELEIRWEDLLIT